MQVTVLVGSRAEEAVVAAACEEEVEEDVAQLPVVLVAEGVDEDEVKAVMFPQKKSSMPNWTRTA